MAEPGAYFQREWGARDLLLVVAGLCLLTLYIGLNGWLGDRPKLSQELPTPKVRPPTPRRPDTNGKMVTRFATSLPTDICPQPKEAQPLSHALTSD
jgi:hypothetical protein